MSQQTTKTKRYKLTLTLLSPVHIGTGEAYTPLNFTIDKDENGKNKVFVFDEVEFFNALEPKDKEEFVKKSGDLRELHAFIKQQKEVAKQISRKKINVAEDGVNDEEKGLVKKFETLGHNQINRFQICRTYRNSNFGAPLIPGSSLKGAVATALADSGKSEEWLKENMRLVSLSDSETAKISFVGTAKNVRRFDEAGKANGKPTLPVFTEYLRSTRPLTATLDLKGGVSMDEIKCACKARYKSLFDEEFTQTNALKYIKEEFKKLKNLSLKENEFLLRVGKHSGFSAVTTKGATFKDPKSGQIKKKAYTTWLINSLPFGWVKCAYEEV